jgi:hypothetical protein
MPLNMQQILTGKKRWWCLLAIAIIATSCTKVDINFGNQTITDPNSVYVDTFTYNLTTFQKDSFVTSSTSNLMIGVQNDTSFGKMTAETYFQLGTPGLNAIANPLSAVLDSARLRLRRKATTAYYGDTTATFSFGFYQVTDQIALQAPKQVAFYNTSSFNAQPTPIATYSTKIRPFLTDSVTVPLDISSGGFANDLFTRLKNNDDNIQTLSKFLLYKPGFVIKPSSTNNAVYSFDGAVDSGVTVRLYYHYSNGNPVKAMVDFPLVNSSNQFNHITTDRTGTPLAAFTPNTVQNLSSKSLSHFGYMQTAGRLQLKLDFPGLRRLRQEVKYQKILSAILYIEPYGYHYSGIYNLPMLTLYTADVLNNPISPVLSTSTGALQTVAPVAQFGVNQYPYYAFDIAQYVTSVINGTTDAYNGLTLESPNYSSNGGVDRMVLADPAYNFSLYKSVQIKLYALTF